MGNPSQTETEQGSGRDQQQKERPEGVPPAASPVEGDKRPPEASNGGAHPSTVKNR